MSSPRRRNREASYDAVIVGSGPNGLAAAALLAREGHSVLVVEAAPTPGGGTRTRELTLPGFQHDVCSAVHPTGAASPVFRELELQSHGLELIHPEIPLAHPLADGRAAVLHRSLEETAAGLGVDRTRYHSFFEPLVEKAEALFPSIFQPLGIPSHPLAMAGFGLRAAPPASLLARAVFRSPEARALFAGNAAHSVLPLEAPLTSAIATVLQFSAHAVGWPVAKGGSQSIADTLVRILEAHGGEWVCDWKIRSLEELPDSRVVLFDTSARAMAKIAGDALPAGYRRRLESFRHGPGVFKVDYALSEPVPWRNSACRRAGTVHVGGTLDEICRSECDAWEGRHSDAPFVLVSQQSVCDPSRAPAGKHTLWAYCHVPAGSDVDMREIIESQIERFAPGFRDTILASHSMNSRDMEGYNANYIGGDIVGGIASWDQLLTRPVARLSPWSTPNPRLFLCSASTPPAGGVHGMCGAHAAAAARKQLQR